MECNKDILTAEGGTHLGISPSETHSAYIKNGQRNVQIYKKRIVVINNFSEKLLSSIVDIDEGVQKIVDDHFWDLL